VRYEKQSSDTAWEILYLAAGGDLFAIDPYMALERFSSRTVIEGATSDHDVVQGGCVSDAQAQQGKCQD
jgi:hypothetical protein